MKKLIYSALLATISSISYSQFNLPWSTTNANTGQSGFVGIGIRPTTASTTLPNFNLHLHGTANYSETVPPIGGNPGGTVDYGITTRFGFTNTTTGMAMTDGTLLRSSGNNFSILNRENGFMEIGTNSTRLIFSEVSKRFWIGGTSTSTSATNARFNVITSDNGMYLQTTASSKYALSLKVTNNTTNAIQVFGISSTAMNFKVTGGGEVFARKYTTTLNNIPDYVFEPSYTLMPLNDLRNYISTYKHLPNVPSANEFAETGVDLGELNRLLLEKVEELTLYILQLEERMQSFESIK